MQLTLKEAMELKVYIWRPQGSPKAAYLKLTYADLRGLDWGVLDPLCSRRGLRRDGASDTKKKLIERLLVCDSCRSAEVRLGALMRLMQIETNSSRHVIE